MKEIVKNLLGKTKAKFNRIKAGKHIYIGFGAKIINGKNITLGDNISIRPNTCIFVNDNAVVSIKTGVDIGAQSRIISGKRIEIEENVLTGPNVFISDQDHQYKNVGIPIKEQGVIIKPGDGICIKEGSWIGTNAVIIGNVKIGKGCVIGANAVVTKDIPDYSVAVGIPAKVIKKYNFETKQWEKIK